MKKNHEERINNLNNIMSNKQQLNSVINNIMLTKGKLMDDFEKTEVNFKPHRRNIRMTAIFKLGIRQASDLYSRMENADDILDPDETLSKYILNHLNDFTTSNEDMEPRERLQSMLSTLREIIMVVLSDQTVTMPSTYSRYLETTTMKGRIGIIDKRFREYMEG